MKASFCALLVLAGCAAHEPPVSRAASVPASTHASSAVIAFVDVTVVPMTDERELPHRTVIIEGDRVARIGPAGEVPQGATVIDGRGKYLMPGLADMHVHLPTDGPRADLERVAALLVASGITTVRGMQGAPNQLDFRAAARRGECLAPALFLAGPPLAETLSTSAMRERVRAQKSAGYDFIKVLGGFDRPAYDAMVDEARTDGIRFCGHVPKEIGIDAALDAKQSSIEHMMGYGAADTAGPDALDALAKRTRDAGVYNCPTLDYFAVGAEGDERKLLARDGLGYVPASDVDEWRRDRKPAPDGDAKMAMRRRIVLALAKAGAPLLVGSDAPGTFAVPGFAYVEELRELARAGLGPYEVMRAATRSAADYLGVADAGAVKAGAVADLVLVDRDPLASVENVARPAGVMLRGKWLTREELDTRIAPFAR
jgi:imidazolonepropionase-like amidohydrolase